MSIPCRLRAGNSACFTGFIVLGSGLQQVTTGPRSLSSFFLHGQYCYSIAGDSKDTKKWCCQNIRTQKQGRKRPDQLWELRRERREKNTKNCNFLVNFGSHDVWLWNCIFFFRWPSEIVPNLMNKINFFVKFFKICFGCYKPKIDYSKLS